MKLSTFVPACVALAVLSSVAVQASPQDTKAPDTKAPAAQQQPAQTYRLTIAVTGGDKNLPVENASVYVKYYEERIIKKDKVTELNVKTNREGIAHIPEPRLGRVLIQVIAEGWKTYGRWYDLTEAKQTIDIQLQRPPKWY